jgi:RHS repeat-associated protein
MPPSSREIVFPAAASGLPAFDAVGRERIRREIRDGDAAAPTIESDYDALGRLQQTRRRAGGSTVADMAFAYDPLGNLLSQTNNVGTGPSTARLSYQLVDRDRICSIAFGGALPGASCSVRYDGVGNITEMPTRGGVTRQLSYFPGGATRSIVMGSTQATFDYDAFGAVQRLSVNTSAPDARNDKHFGDLIVQRDERVNLVRTAVLNRSFPGPSGFIATRHGPGAGDPWTFVFGEERGNRFVTDQTGAFVQDVDYQPYGETLPQPFGELPGSQKYLSEQWNGGDALTAFGVSQLGVRIYDPVIGRFLSRDPLLLPRTAATTNPYAFALNDPINRSDPSGLDDRIDIYRRYQNESGSMFGFSWTSNILSSLVSHAGNLLGAVFAGWTAGGGDMVARQAAPTASFNAIFNATPGANPTSSGGGAGGGSGGGSAASGSGRTAGSGSPASSVDASDFMYVPQQCPGACVAIGAVLPKNPGELGPEWTKDPRHVNPNDLKGGRWVHDTGTILDWHNAQPGKRGWRGKDHWHVDEEKKHTPPGVDHPGFPEPVGSKARTAAKVGASIGLGYLVYRAARLVPSVLPPLWWTIPANVAIP